MIDLRNYRGKKVLVTGHTGFKGSWMCQALLSLGAEVTGYALEPPTEPSLFQKLHLGDDMCSVIGDVRDHDKLLKIMHGSKPEIVIHMAAQPIVRESYKHPADTYEINVMGTVNVLEGIRNTDSVSSFVNVTTDKVYLNKEWEWGYRENEELNGYDPYSNSKSCSELVTASYRRSFFKERDTAITTMRAGNVIGGGDFAVDRIIPDCVRAVTSNREIIVRNPDSVRPYQHVLEPVMAYLMVAFRQYEDQSVEGSYNVGPKEENCITTGQMAELFCRKWTDCSGENAKWQVQRDQGPHEAKLLKLDCSRIKEVFGWQPVWDIERTIEETVNWYYQYEQKADMRDYTQKQIECYLQG